MNREQTDKVRVLAEGMETALLDSDPTLAGAALAVVTARWLAAHRGKDEDQTMEYQHVTLQNQLETIIKLTAMFNRRAKEGTDADRRNDPPH